MTAPGEVGTSVPRWVLVGLLPVINLAAALIVSGVVILLIGEDPVRALVILVKGAFGYQEGIGYTLYYTTNFMFTGLAFAVAFHCGLFNIGGEGQAYLGGLGVGLVCMYLDFLPFILLLPLAIVGAGIFGGVWGFIPGYLQARRGSHTVITTIMFNFIGAAVMVYLLTSVLIMPGQMSPETREFLPHTWLPFVHVAAAWLGIDFAPSPWNLSFLLALLSGFFVWIFIWHTRWGYEIRTVGANKEAAVYAGISVPRSMMLAMGISGALSGMMGLNEIMGVNHRLLLNFTAGYGFVGIAVSLMGRSHPIGIFMASLLFGALYQGGADLAFETPKITTDMVVMIQGLVILFAGALEFLFLPYITLVFRRRQVVTAAVK